MLHDINHFSVIMSLKELSYLHQSNEKSMFDETIKRPHSTTQCIIWYFYFLHP